MVEVLKAFLLVALFITTVFFALIRMVHIAEESGDFRKKAIKIWAYLMALIFEMVVILYFGGGS